jgi:hypothetical protein
MRPSIAFALVVAFAGGAVLSAGLARAEDPAAPPMPKREKQLQQAFLDALVGTWNVETTGGMTGKGKATFAKGVGGTALLETYETSDKGEAFNGHGIHKVSEDGKTVTVWWFDDFSAKPLELTGPLTDTGYEISGECPHGPMKITFEKKGDALLFKMFMGGQEAMVGNYTKAK